ncbi:hypothetical protein ABTX81_37945 [Kitasatospora sp. NPDC097605]|uniref:hypothetical protein n=1 Tax=Kitasatospora sp. NPDC097605 TaxID=3157226 RepID=UPI003324E5BA
MRGARREVRRHAVGRPAASGPPPPFRSGPFGLVEGVEVVAAGACVQDGRAELLAVHRLRFPPPGGGRLRAEGLQSQACSR